MTITEVYDKEISPWSEFISNQGLIYLESTLTSFAALPSPNDSLLPGIDSRLCAVTEMELFEDIPDMSLDGALAETELLGDLAITITQQP